MSPPNNDLARDGPSSRVDSPDQHRHLHGAVASHFLAQPRGDSYGGETWVDFLREAGEDPARMRPHPTHTSTAASNMDSPSSASPFALPSRPPPRTDTPSSGSSSDRKRRLTTAESPIRRGSGMSGRAHSSSHAGSGADPIVLDSSPAPQLRERPLPPPPNYTPSQPPRPFRRESDLVLPPWQPDSDVSSCPCSPHRITIPRQFIVHPPSDGSNSIIDLTGDDEANPMSNFGPFRNPALGGGEEVRSADHSYSCHAARGMFPYIATEKDCVDEDGNDAECVICFEEFEAGDKMARLVCWCKFHEKCIKEWWKMKGRGACPTHQLHEE
ncbi:hypothetical protein N0V91_007785 [Didymella pomorum]|uniref:RING-type E3 ubiquitin transferase n=1 Tax=Didymella pomorum TaxID=749634 RepID=A0A9W8Z7Y0_9PLEO|nr:hypothetical protein N0V91_007785 [Didymella pomorum]